MRYYFIPTRIWKWKSQSSNSYEIPKVSNNQNKTEKEKIGGLTLLNFKTHYKATVIQAVIFCLIKAIKIKMTGVGKDV